MWKTAFKKIWSSRPYHIKFFEGCLPQILLGPFEKSRYFTGIYFQEYTKVNKNLPMFLRLKKMLIQAQPSQLRWIGSFFPNKTILRKLNSNVSRIITFWKFQKHFSRIIHNKAMFWVFISVKLTKIREIR